MINLYIDFDGVIMNSIEVGYEEIKKLGLEVNEETCKNYFTNIDWHEFLNKKCEPINNSIECIQSIIDSNLFNVNILSHVVSLDEAVEKIKYIRKYFKDITFIPVPKKISKTKMVHTVGSILIDDYSGNLREWENAGGIGVRFSEKLNGKGFYVINRLDQVIEYINLTKS
ncbi:MAG: hypothetical protein E7166_01450 [Firmicutes bacterium]|nr:hypothetical protein [Bacillota bacterium]